MRRIWIVEFYDGKKWHTTMYAGLTKREAEMEMREAEFHNSWEYEKFRIVKYTPNSSTPKGICLK